MLLESFLSLPLHAQVACFWIMAGGVIELLLFKQKPPLKHSASVAAMVTGAAMLFAPIPQIGQCTIFLGLLTGLQHIFASKAHA